MNTNNKRRRARSAVTVYVHRLRARGASKRREGQCPQPRIRRKLVPSRRTFLIASYGSSIPPYLPPDAPSPYPWSSNGSLSGSSSTLPLVSAYLVVATLLPYPLAIPGSSNSRSPPSA